MPPAVKWLLISNLLVFLAGFILDSVMPGFSLNSAGALYYLGAPYFRIYQPVSYMFLHADFWHLFFNMFALWMFGRVMEQTWGSKRFLFYYFACGIGAGLVQELLQLCGVLSPAVSTIGASGAIYGILLAFAMTYPNERIYIIPIPIPIKVKYFIGFYVLLEIYEGMHTTVGDNVAHFAHLGGMLVGLLIILYWRYKKQMPHIGVKMGGRSDRPSRDEHAHHYQSDGPASATNTTSYAQRDAEENANIDRILDKIRQGGYASLTDDEKNQLFRASQR